MNLLLNWSWRKNAENDCMEDYYGDGWINKILTINYAIFFPLRRPWNVGVWFYLSAFPLPSRLVLIGLDETWLKDYKQKIMINGNVPTWLGSGARGRAIHNSWSSEAFFFFFFNDLEEKVNCMLMKFADNIKLEGVIDRHVDREHYGSQP